MIDLIELVEAIRRVANDNTKQDPAKGKPPTGTYRLISLPIHIYLPTFMFTYLPNFMFTYPKLPITPK